MSWFTDNALGVISLVGSGLGAFAGAVWWMSAVYSRVRSIHERVDEFVLDHKA